MANFAMARSLAGVGVKQRKEMEGVAIAAVVLWGE
jgi:hypothetical protein